jgi:hypothetical protein
MNAVWILGDELSPEHAALSQTSPDESRVLMIESKARSSLLRWILRLQKRRQNTSIAWIRSQRITTVTWSTTSFTVGFIPTFRRILWRTQRSANNLSLFLVETFAGLLNLSLFRQSRDAPLQQARETRR